MADMLVSSIVVSAKSPPNQRWIDRLPEWRWCSQLDRCQALANNPLRTTLIPTNNLARGIAGPLASASSVKVVNSWPYTVTPAISKPNCSAVAPSRATIPITRPS